MGAENRSASRRRRCGDGAAGAGWPRNVAEPAAEAPGAEAAGAQKMRMGRGGVVWVQPVRLYATRHGGSAGT